MRIEGADGKECRIGEIGEITASGPNIMKGYYHNEQASIKVLYGGWLHTGDIGYVDEDGYLYIKGRSKNISSSQTA